MLGARERCGSAPWKVGLPGNLAPRLCLCEEAPSAWPQLDQPLPGMGQWSGSVGEGRGFQAASTITVFVPNREFSKEPELMPRTPSQKNRRKKRRISSIQDENRDPIRKR